MRNKYCFINVKLLIIIAFIVYDYLCFYSYVPGLGTEAEKVEILSPFFFSTPRKLLVIPKFGSI